jgi:hypothetical protein
MKGRYLDLENISHLLEQSKGGGIHDHKLWRESYYFNMTDPDNNISVITTLGFLPNRNRSIGFLLIIRNGRPVFLKPLIKVGKPKFSGYEFKISAMSYSIEGIDWRLRFRDKKFDLDLRFSPLNRIYSYKKDNNWKLDPIGTQHYEQFGTFTGTIELNGERMKIGPCLGHRDHSWGIRDWAGIERYSLHCCAFSKKLAFNLWEGNIDGRSFNKGFVFDGDENVDIVDMDIQTNFGKKRKEPILSKIEFRDSMGRIYELKCRSIVSVPFPPQGSVVYEGIGKMMMNGKEGYGLQEYLHHLSNAFRRTPYFLRLLSMKGVFR